MAGRYLVELGDPVFAVPLLTAPIDRYDHAHAREVALYQTWLAEAYMLAGQVDAGRDVLAKAREGASEISSARLARRVEAIERLAR